MEEVPICQEALITLIKPPENLHRNAYLGNLQCGNRKVYQKYLHFSISLVFVQSAGRTGLAHSQQAVRQIATSITLSWNQAQNKTRQNLLYMLSQTNVGTI